MENNPTQLDLFLEEIKILLNEYGVDSVFFGEPDGEGRIFIYRDKGLTKSPLIVISTLSRDLSHIYTFLYLEQIGETLRIATHFEVHGTGGAGMSIRYYPSVSDLTEELEKSMNTRRSWSEITQKSLRRLRNYCKNLNLRPLKLR